MKEQRYQHRQQDIIEKLMSEIYQQFRSGKVNPPFDTARLIATDLLVELIEEKTNQDGRTVIKQLADKIRTENYKEDLLAAVDMVEDVVGDELPLCIPNKVSNYFASRPDVLK